MDVVDGCGGVGGVKNCPQLVIVVHRAFWPTAIQVVMVVIETQLAVLLVLEDNFGNGGSDEVSVAVGDTRVILTTNDDIGNGGTEADT